MTTFWDLLPAPSVRPVPSAIKAYQSSLFRRTFTYREILIHLCAHFCIPNTIVPILLECVMRALATMRLMRR